MPKEAKKITTPGEAERTAVRELVKAARARGEDLTGPGGLLKTITATVLQAARWVLFSTNAIESLNARYRRAVGTRGHSPTEQAALKCLYLVTRGLDPKGTGQARWTMRWKPALNAFAVTFADRMPAAENL